MIRKIAMSFSLLFVFAGLVFGQQAPQSEKKVERSFQIFVGDNQSFLGVQPVEVTKENFSKFGLSEVRGVAIEKVIENSPASQAGLQNGDVITRINGDEISSMRKLMRVISEIAPDHQARVTVVRGGSEKEISVTMGRRPIREIKVMPPTRVPLGDLRREFPFPHAEEFGDIQPMQIPLPEIDENVFVWRGMNQRRIGVGVSPLTKQLGEHFGVADGKGLLVNDVRENSAAAKAGIRAGDVIVEADGKAMGELRELIKAIDEKKEGEIALTIIRDKERRTIRVTPEKATELVPNTFNNLQIQRVY